MSSSNEIKEGRERALSVLADHGGSLTLGDLTKEKIPAWALSNLLVSGNIRIKGDTDDDSTVVEVADGSSIQKRLSFDEPEKKVSPPASSPRTGYPSACVPPFVVQGFKESMARRS